jgi:iron complex transport system ATP-binding protein
MTGRHELKAENLDLAYEGRPVVSDLDLVVPPGCITAVVGPNACGKSTLLRGLSRLLKPRRGVVLLDGAAIHTQPTKKVAAKLGILPQTPSAPGGITVAELVGRGRFPHQSWMGRWSHDDADAVAEAMARTAIVDLAARPVDELSGGQRQRTWIAMALAQQTDILLLDEPITYLDLAHQMEVLDLLVDLNRDGRTILLVLHDLNHASRYGHHLVVMNNGSIVTQGTPDEVISEQLVADVFGLSCKIMADPATGGPLVIPLGRHPTPFACPDTSRGGHVES